MKAPPAPLLALFARMREHAAAGTLHMDEGGAIPASDYFCAERLAQERAVLFRRYPLILGHASELAPASARAADAGGLPVLLTRDEQGDVRAFLNVCRHRGMRVLDAEAVCSRPTLVCPYHGWTYSLDGKLKHHAHPEAFPGLQPEQHGLVELPCALRHGLIWVLPTPGATLQLESYLGPIDRELAYFLGDSVLERRIDVVRKANWKLIIDAFLDGYHIRVLHRDSIYPFFMDALAISESVPPHIRSVAARRKISEAVALPQEQWNLREHCSFTYFVFPNTVFIFHPDYASVISVFPVDTDHLRWVHQMVIPRAQHTAARQAHWEKTFNLIEQTVFQREDLFAAEGIQAGLRSGANKYLTVGRLEHPIRDFHAAIQHALDQA
ncbi:MAG: aromatic ring-hydroxylating oxygenase subunit alpha [Nevskiales bacterium]